MVPVLFVGEEDVGVFVVELKCFSEVRPAH